MDIVYRLLGRFSAIIAHLIHINCATIALHQMFVDCIISDYNSYSFAQHTQSCVHNCTPSTSISCLPPGLGKSETQRFQVVLDRPGAGLTWSSWQLSPVGRCLWTAAIMTVEKQSKDKSCGLWNKEHCNCCFFDYVWQINLGS